MQVIKCYSHLSEAYQIQGLRELSRGKGGHLIERRDLSQTEV